MNKYFIISSGPMTGDQEKQLSEIWKSYAWWHAVPNLWLLRDHTNTFTAVSVRDAIFAVAPSARVMVVEVDPKTWAAGAMTDSNRNWLRDYWPPEGE